MPKHEREQSHIVQAMQVIGMLMRIEHGMDKPDLFTKQLRTQIRGGINQQVTLG
jgi:hypothetical protein